LTPDRPDPTPEDAELGVLSDAANSDTAVLGILGGTTAQVSVSLPPNDEDDLSDDDVVDDEVDFAPEDQEPAEDDADCGQHDGRPGGRSFLRALGRKGDDRCDHAQQSRD